MVKKLVFDAQEAAGELDELELAMPDGKIIVIYQPTSGQIALMLEAFASDSDDSDSIKALLDFYRDITVPEGYQVIEDFLRDPTYLRSLEALSENTLKIIEAFTGNPTKRPTDYLPSRRTGGPNSTATRRQPGSTPSRSRRVGSATGSTPSSSDG